MNRTSWMFYGLGLTCIVGAAYLNRGLSEALMVGGGGLVLGALLERFAGKP